METELFCECSVIHKEVVDKVGEKMPQASQMSKLSELFKLVGDHTRARILWALGINEMCVCDLAALFDMTKSAISHQLKLLRLGNLVKSRREGKVIYYSLTDAHVVTILQQGFAHIEE